MNASAPPLSSSSLAPAIEPANQPIPPGSAATPLYMNKASSSGDAASDEHAAAAGATSSSHNAAPAPAPGVRVLTKTASTDSMLADDRGTEPGQSSSGGGTPNASGGKQRKYERKTKRFIWPDELHRLFIAAIFDVGLKNASPKALLGLMEAAGPDTGLTTEHLKSHLQKYRLNYERSRAEFLEYYDQSHKRNHKRRRKSGSKPGEPNTMFVFPIAHKKSRRGGSDDSDSDDDEGGGTGTGTGTGAGADDAMSDSTPRSSSASLQRTESSASLERSSSFTSMMHDPKDPMNAAAIAFAQQQQQYLQMMNAGTAGDRLSFSNGMAANHAYAAGGASRKGSQHGASSGSSHHASSAAAAAAMNHRAIAAAAAAAAYQQRFGLPMGAGSALGGASSAATAAIGQLGGDLSDPQWSILSSLMSPRITGVNSGAVHGGGMGGPTSDGLGASGGSDQFQLQEEANDLQLQMHLAMQAQMNLHRQMLTRKMSLTAASAAGLGPAPRPSLAPRTSSSSNVLAAPGAMASMGMGGHPTHPGRAPIPIAVGPTVTVTNAMLQESGGHDGTLSASVGAAAGGTLSSSGLGYDKSGGSAGTTPAPGASGDDDALDLYRWDRIDLNVELDDDDLFGFLKS
ncbi:hypothetical protein PybrP1_008210 [[Pythium] brassicae (nom. inval.)]|nr:hypothetical protein PybrP1_008210 [[Pythium] brassicae (nom. inval.)]